MDQKRVWQYLENGTWHSFYDEEAKSLNAALSTQGERPNVTTRFGTHLFDDSDADYYRLQPLTTGHVYRVQFSSPTTPLPPSALTTSYSSNSDFEDFPGPPTFERRIYRSTEFDSQSWTLPAGCLAIHQPYAEDEATFERVKHFFISTSLPDDALKAWVKYILSPPTSQPQSALTECKDLAFVVHILNKLEMGTDYAEYYFGALLLPCLDDQAILELLSRLWTDRHITWSEKDRIIRFIFDEIWKRELVTLAMAFQLPRDSELRLALQQPQSREKPPKRCNYGPRFIASLSEEQMVQLEIDRISRLSQRPRSGNYPPLGQNSHSSPLASPRPLAPQPEEEDSHSLSIDLPPPPRAPVAASAYLEPQMGEIDDIIATQAKAMTSGSMLLNTPRAQLLRNGHLTYIATLMQKDYLRLSQLLLRASSEGGLDGALALADKHICIPKEVNDAPLPLCQLWEDTILLTSVEQEEAIEWEILCPTRADDSVFFTCAHQISTDPDLQSDWSPSGDPFVFKGELQPGEVLPLLLSYVPLRALNGLAFTHLVCVRLRTKSGKKTSSVFIAVRAAASIQSTTSDSKQPYWAVPRNEVYRGQKLGQGSFGSVYSASIRGMRCSLKYWSPVTLDFSIELGALRYFHHENLIPFIGAYDNSPSDAPYPRQGEAFVLLKYASEGNLNQVCTRENPRFADGQVFQMALEIALALQYLHIKGCIHRDVKSLNVLVDNGSARLIDFGSLRKVDDARKSRAKTGSLPWVAPEVMAPTPTYSAATDVFSFGIVLYELAARSAPPIRSPELVESGAVPSLPKAFAKAYPNYQNLYRSCTMRDPLNRASIDTVVNALTELCVLHPVDTSSFSSTDSESVRSFESQLFNSSPNTQVSAPK